MRRSSLSPLVFTALAFALGCESGAVLVVELRTDFVPGEELGSVRVEALEGSAPVGLSTTNATFGESFVEGVRVLEAEGLEDGTYSVNTELRAPDGRIVTSRRVIARVVGDTAVTVVVSRDSVACDPASCAPGETCAGAICVSEECTPETPATCPPPDCAIAEDCAPRAACSARFCAFGTCLYGVVDGSCAETEWCNPDTGCLPRGAIVDGGPDGGGCPAGFADCDGDETNGCERPVSDDPVNCGGCGVRCDSGPRGTPTCAAGACALECEDGFGDCNLEVSDGCEADLSIDNASCGACGSACPMGLPVCDEGDCIAQPFPSDGSEGAYAPTADEVLGAGVHHFTTVTIPAGVTVRTDGVGVLELRATGDVVIDGIVDLSGGTGGASITGNYGGGGGGGTGNAVDGADGDPAMCQPSGRGGLGVPGMDATGECGEGGRNGGGAGSGNGGSGSGGGAAGGGGTPPGGASAGNTGGGAGGGGAEPGFGVYSGTDGRSDDTGAGGGGSIGAAAISDLAMATTFYPGSGGGGGTGRVGSFDGGGGGGGGGGGALRIASNTLIQLGPSAALLVSGGDGGMPHGGLRGSGGGGGSGGALYLSAPALELAGTLDATGGAGGRNSTRAIGGDGGLGRIRFSTDTDRCVVTASVNPPLPGGVCMPNTDPELVYVAEFPD